MRILLALALVASAFGQEPDSKEDEDLRKGMGEAGSSPIEIIRALERHLSKYPDSKRRDEIERALAKSAIDARDTERTIRYGEKLLAKTPDDLVVLERVSRALTSKDDKPSSERGLQYAKRFTEGMIRLGSQPSEGRVDGQMREELDRGIARGYIYQAKAQSNLGKHAEAESLAKKGFDVYPSAEPAREIARALAKQDKLAESLPYWADAFALPDSRFNEEDRLQVRKDMGAVYSKVHGGEKGMGDLLLAAYDRALETQAKIKSRLRAVDPNSQQSDPMQFTLTGVNGGKLDLKSLRGKVVIFDFWATWCGPCRVQYPMYEKVKQNFNGRDDVVFLGINTDEDRGRVKPFLDENKWAKAVYFEDGLASLLSVRSIPTTMIFNRKGELVTRLNGFVPERFVEMLTERIRDTLAQN